MSVLVFLAQNADETVSSQDIIDGPWNGIMVAESSIYRAISDLRKLLGDNDQTRTYIKTIPRRGYQLIASVEFVDSLDRVNPVSGVKTGEEDLLQDVAGVFDGEGKPQSSPGPDNGEGLASALSNNRSQTTLSTSTQRRKRWVLWTVPTALLLVAALAVTSFLFPIKDLQAPPSDPARLSIAVLPFKNLSNDPRQDYLSDGIADELINLLAQLNGLQVSARRSSFAYKNTNLGVQEIARQLDVETVLEGSVRREGGSLRVSAQLISAETGFHIWSQSFESDLSEILLLQDKISSEISLALRPFLGKSEPIPSQTRKTSLVVFDAYLLGQHYLNQSNKAALAKALAYFDSAISLDPKYAPAYIGKAKAYLLLSEKDYGGIPEEDAVFGASVLIDAALEIDPDFVSAVVAKGQLQFRASQFDTAGATFDRAVGLDPNLSDGHFWRGRVLARHLLIDDAADAFRRAHSLDPLTMSPLINLIQCLVMLGEFDEANERIDRFQQLAPDEPSTFASSIVASSQGRLADAYRGAEEAAAANDFEYYHRELSIALLALKATEEAYRQAPDTSPAYRYSSDDFELVSRIYLDLPGATPTGSNIWLNSAISEFLKKKFLNSASYFELAIRGDEAIDGPLFSLSPDRSHAPYLAYAWQRSGNHGRALPLINTIEEALNRYKESGTLSRHLILQARLAILKEDNAAAMTALKEAHQSKVLSWYILQEPFFDGIRDRDDFGVLTAKVSAHLNEERAKLGWDPVQP